MPNSSGGQQEVVQQEEVEVGEFGQQDDVVKRRITVSTTDSRRPMSRVTSEMFFMSVLESH